MSTTSVAPNIFPKQEVLDFFQETLNKEKVNKNLALTVTPNAVLALSVSTAALSTVVRSIMYFNSADASKTLFGLAWDVLTDSVIAAQVGAFAGLCLSTFALKSQLENVMDLAQATIAVAKMDESAIEPSLNISETIENQETEIA